MSCSSTVAKVFLFSGDSFDRSTWNWKNSASQGQLVSSCQTHFYSFYDVIVLYNLEPIGLLLYAFGIRYHS